MGYVELAYDLRTEPTDGNVKSAQNWLSKQKKSGESVYTVLTALIEARPDAKTLEWFESWLPGRDLDLHQLFFVKSAAVHDWLIDFLRQHNDDEKLGKLWHQLMFDFTLPPSSLSYWPKLLMSDDQPLIEGSSEWLIAHGNGEEDSVFVARCLAKLTKRSDVQMKIMEILRASNDSDLAATILEHTTNDAAIEIGIEMLNAVSHRHGSNIATQLLKTDPQRYWPKVEPFLRRHWVDKDVFPYTLGKMMHQAPLVVAPLAFEWIDDYPKSKMIASIVTLAQTQESVDLIWAGLQPRTTKPFAPEILEILLLHYRGLSMPKEATEFADDWLHRNQNHKRFFNILAGVLRAGATDVRLQLARNWLDKLTDEEERGCSLMVLRRRAPKNFNDEALAWASKHPNILQSIAIINEYKELPDSPMDDF
ncbi:MAG: hypothetical protein JST89_09290 [Cyanobacteria bacterium SZAS-4]|nr:hypothetical protein [Cyanobacteria bacterium SZAS-4]